MAFSVSGRERNILIVTIVLGVVALVYHFGLSDLLGSFDQEREQLRQERETYQRYIRELQREKQVTADFAELMNKYPMTDQRVKEFRASIDAAFRSANMTPTIDPPEIEQISGAEDYGFVILAVKSAGNIDSLTKILNYFDRQAIQIKKIDLTTRVDDPNIQMNVTVRQIVKITDEIKAKAEKRPGAFGGREVRPREPLGL